MDKRNETVIAAIKRRTVFERAIVHSATIRSAAVVGEQAGGILRRHLDVD